MGIKVIPSSNAFVYRQDSTVVSATGASLNKYEIPATAIAISGSTTIAELDTVKINGTAYTSAANITTAATVYIGSPTIAGGGSISKPLSVYCDGFIKVGTKVTTEVMNSRVQEYHYGSDTTLVGQIQGASDGLYIDSANIVLLNSSYVERFRIQANGVTFSGQQRRKVTAVNAATYDLVVTDDILDVTYTATGAVTNLRLMTAQMLAGRTIVVKDGGLLAGTNNITITTEGSEQIDGADTYVINANGGSVTLTVNAAGTGWRIIGKYTP